jgi:bisphosphoglycerate-independent phosphoglycerate mutase (AlkP superfamily)
VNVQYVATFNDVPEMSSQMIQTELAEAMNLTSNGTFLGNSYLQSSDNTNLTQVANELTVQGSNFGIFLP